MSRRDIYYWKCDRPAAFHGTGPRPRGDEVSEKAIRVALSEYFRQRLPVAEPATVPTDDRETHLAPSIANGAESPSSERSHVPLPIEQPVAEPATVPTNDRETHLAQSIANGAESPSSERSHVPLPIEQPVAEPATVPTDDRGTHLAPSIANGAESPPSERSHVPLPSDLPVAEPATVPTDDLGTHLAPSIANGAESSSSERSHVPLPSILPVAEPATVPTDDRETYLAPSIAKVAESPPSERSHVPLPSILPVAEPATVPTDDRATHLAQSIANGAESPPSERWHVPLPIELSPAAGQGNHLTWNAEIDGNPAFLRIENGPEGDDHLEMESAVLDQVAKTGVPVPRVLGCDASRAWVPFAWQALERIPHPDLNQWWKAGTLDEPKIAREIGRHIARWQTIEPQGFGPFDLDAWRSGKGLVGFHPDYPTYYHLRLEDHLRFLVARSFFSSERADEIRALIAAHADLLRLDRGVLVHKDLALWNVLGTPDAVVAVIDFDDAISGDPLDDLSLLACFHNRAFLEQAFAGYASGRALPDDWRPRFWLHLLRNLIVKAVIRVGAGYFERDSGFFLIGSGGSGADLRRFTEERIELAMRSLQEGAGLEMLE